MTVHAAATTVVTRIFGDFEACNTEIEQLTHSLAEGTALNRLEEIIRSSVSLMPRKAKL